MIEFYSKLSWVLLGLGESARAPEEAASKSMMRAFNGSQPAVSEIMPIHAGQMKEAKQQNVETYIGTEDTEETSFISEAP
ncbi:hypothetical protein GUITHDRAFT_107573 [Guillardia theta CCMP2712]|uniref:Uncharacterized protein n=1 Tax=Guillardia theta (strain CCMP2712) TaxID=905079 RepID=L1JE56_GUITC|nr:hypothetical protein GUITHDRAFT_107573 [Guillardia theta CCMP2712]EKX46798.1 hypothetical protein GUITHDRAFT_107573 [Guillardia theta CCMP2712]|eukprot:XP_005833778.1 hypothetical protein GUITHDRAFT_107573 [Guillardia theta CCMP2712]